MHAHYRVVASGTYKSRLLTVVRAAVFMIHNTIGQLHSRANRRSIQPAAKVNPLAAVTAPGLPAKRDRDAGGNQLAFKLGEVGAGHAN